MVVIESATARTTYRSRVECGDTTVVAKNYNGMAVIPIARLAKPWLEPGCTNKCNFYSDRMMDFDEGLGRWGSVTGETEGIPGHYFI